MARHTRSEYVQIVVALIGLVGVVSAALIATSQKKVDADKTSESVNVGPSADRVSVSEAPASAGSVKITGVVIGKAEGEPFVAEAFTRFGPQDVVAVTVRYQAEERVANFPVRISARIMSSMLNGIRESTTDVSRGGDAFWTFRFSPDDEWVGQQFVSIQINGRDVYSQEFDVTDE